MSQFFELFPRAGLRWTSLEMEALIGDRKDKEVVFPLAFKCLSGDKGHWVLS